MPIVRVRVFVRCFVKHHLSTQYATKEVAGFNTFQVSYEFDGLTANKKNKLSRYMPSTRVLDWNVCVCVFIAVVGTCCTCYKVYYFSEHTVCLAGISFARSSILLKNVRKAFEFLVSGTVRREFLHHECVIGSC